MCHRRRLGNDACISRLPSSGSPRGPAGLCRMLTAGLPGRQTRDRSWASDTRQEDLSGLWILEWNSSGSQELAPSSAPPPPRSRSHVRRRGYYADRLKAEDRQVSTGSHSEGSQTGSQIAPLNETAYGSRPRRTDVSIGLIALLDDVAALAKVAAASLDDVAGQAAKAGAKAAGVVIDDAAVTPLMWSASLRRASFQS